LEEEAEPEPEFIGEDAEKTEEIVSDLEEFASYILCRLEAERPSQELIEQDINGMEAFLNELMMVDDINVDYRFENGDEEKTITSTPDFFLDRRGRRRNEPALPFVKILPDEDDQNRLLARALCEYLGVSQFEGVVTLLNAETDEQRQQYLRLAGAPATVDEIEGKRRDLFEEGIEDDSGVVFDPEEEREGEDVDEELGETPEHEQELTQREHPDTRQYPVYDAGDLNIGGSSITITTEPDDSDSDEDNGGGGDSDGSNGMVRVSQHYTNEVDAVGMAVTIQYERNRLKDEFGCEGPDDYVFDVHNEEQIEQVKEHAIGGKALEELEETGLPLPFPGFDILTVNPETDSADRLIELKSSGHDIRTPSLTWNEWKTARTSEVQDLYYLYIIGNLRKDVKSDPYLRELPNPFALLNAERRQRRETTNEVKVDVRSFKKETEITETPILAPSEGE
jgi:hypothetical protein